ncbi:MAG: hypothetical protein WCN92_10395, partial [Eubacteriales bacterium]
MKVNEATFEANISSILQKNFPFLNKDDIAHQQTFTVKMGQQEITNKSKQAKGRLDVLIKYKDKPLAVLELKSPKTKLLKNDIDQAVSYARLLDPM